jgi:transcriptional regulator with XRE-family HTH domain
VRRAELVLHASGGSDESPEQGYVEGVDTTDELSQFLISRRARVTPEQAGLPSYGRRQVPGLRREEVASLAGVSVDYYKRLERGNATGASDNVLDAIADALRLDDAERTHLFDLARAAAPTPARRRHRPAQQAVRPAVQQILDTIGSPATLSNLRGDYVAANALGRALYAPLFESREQPPNGARLRSWIRPLRSSSSSGRRRPRTSWPPSATRPVTTRTTARCLT